MHIGIITRKVWPEHCGIGDHSLLLANALRHAGHQATVIANEGNIQEHIYLVRGNWSIEEFTNLYTTIEFLHLDHLVLQLTPQLYLDDRAYENPTLLTFWQHCSQRWPTSLIIHETFFWRWWHPVSWIRGIKQKHLLRTIANYSNHLFTASQPLLKTLHHWGFDNKMTRLPLGSHFPFISSDRGEVKKQQGVAEDEIVLTIFSGGSALREQRAFVNDLDAFLHKNRVRIRWLLLGDVPQAMFRFTAPVLCPGYLPPEELSRWLQMTDIFLVPHRCGLTAKRSTLMAALQHGLPVVGTKGYMTDQFWDDVPGVILAPIHNSRRFCKEVLHLCNHVDKRQALGKANQNYYQENLTWNKIASLLLETIT